MIVKLNPRGSSFAGLVAYLLTGRAEEENPERVLWADTGNLLTQDLEKAAKLMSWTDRHGAALKARSGAGASGRKPSSRAVYHYSLSWAKGEAPSPAHQRREALATIKTLALEEHQYLLVAHGDTDHPHLHVVINLTHPVTGRRHDPGLDRRKLQSWARAYERAHGLHCPRREENAKARDREGAKAFYEDKKDRLAPLITKVYREAKNGAAFLEGLKAHGLLLAKGRKSFVLVTREGEVLNLSRLVQGARTKEIKEKLSDLEGKLAFAADRLAKLQRAAKRQPPSRQAPSKTRQGPAPRLASFDRDGAERAQQNRMLDAADRYAQTRSPAPRNTPPPREPPALPARRVPAREHRAGPASEAQGARQASPGGFARLCERYRYWCIPELSRDVLEATEAVSAFPKLQRLAAPWRYRELLQRAWTAGKSLENALARFEQDFEGVYQGIPGDERERLRRFWKLPAGPPGSERHKTAAAAVSQAVRGRGLAGAPPLRPAFKEALEKEEALENEPLQRPRAGPHPDLDRER